MQLSNEDHVAAFFCPNHLNKVPHVEYKLSLVHINSIPVEQQISHLLGIALMNQDVIKVVHDTSFKKNVLKSIQYSVENSATIPNTCLSEDHTQKIFKLPHEVFPHFGENR